MKILQKYITLAVLLLATPVASPAAGVPAPAAKPNIVLILIDDFGYENVTANGGESYKTPVMDQLAATGVRFEQCHVQPLCTPTRVELMSRKLMNERQSLCEKMNKSALRILRPVISLEERILRSTVKCDQSRNSQGGEDCAGLFNDKLFAQ